MIQKLFMTEAGKLMFDLHGESYGYEQEPRFLSIPFEVVTLENVRITAIDKRNVVYIEKVM